MRFPIMGGQLDIPRAFQSAETLSRILQSQRQRRNPEVFAVPGLVQALQQQQGGVSDTQRGGILDAFPRATPGGLEQIIGAVQSKALQARKRQALSAINRTASSAFNTRRQGRATNELILQGLPEAQRQTSLQLIGQLENLGLQGSLDQLDSLLDAFPELADDPDIREALDAAKSRLLLPDIGGLFPAAGVGTGAR